MKTLLISLLLAVSAAAGAAPTLAAPVESLRVTGTIVSVSSTSLQLATGGGQTMTFRLVPTTTFDENGQAIDAPAPAAGQPVLVKYHQEANGSLKAKEVRVEPPSSSVTTPAVIVTATLVSLSPGTVTVKPTSGGATLTLRLVPETVYELHGKPAALSDLRAGQRLRIKYHLEPDGSVKAKKIKILAEPAVSFRLEGTLLAASATHMRIRVGGGKTIDVAVDAGTKVTENGRRTRAASLAVGDRVQVVGLASGGVYTAQQIRAQRIARKR